MILTESITVGQLIQQAMAARAYAYAPYSRYQVGAALCTKDGQIYSGCNIENASYGATNCAERTAFFRAVSEGKRDFTAIAIVGGPAGGTPTTYAYPCGICRQVMQEFCRDDFWIITALDENNYQTWRFRELFPLAFGEKQMR